MNKHKTFSAFLCALISAFSFLQVKAQIPYWLEDTLQRQLDDLCIKNQVKGISAAVYVPGMGVWRGVTGISHGSVPIDTSMLFSIGSITKNFMATEILKLVEEGKLSLADSIGQFVPPHPHIKNNITIKQLLQHKAGLGDVTNTPFFNAVFADLNKRWSPQTVIDSFLTAPVWQPGAGFYYSNAGYMLLGMVAEQIEGDSLHHIFRKRFSNPLGLNNTHLHMFDPFNYPIPHNWSTPSLDPALAQDVSYYPHAALWTTAAADGGLFSSAPDLVRWGYKLFTGKVIDTALVKQMSVFTPVASGYYNGYGMGCMRFPYAGNTYIGHAGNYIGFAASMLFHPKDSICAAVLVNQDCISPMIALPLIRTAVNTLKILGTGDLHKNKDEIDVYPNPVSDKIFIRTLDGAPVRVELRDVSGRQVLVTEGIAGTISTEEIPEGLYLMEVETRKGNKYSRKIVVSRG